MKYMIPNVRNVLWFSSKLKYDYLTISQTTGAPITKLLLNITKIINHKLLKSFNISCNLRSV